MTSFFYKKKSVFAILPSVKSTFILRIWFECFTTRKKYIKFYIKLNKFEIFRNIAKFFVNFGPNSIKYKFKFATNLILSYFN